MPLLSKARLIGEPAGSPGDTKPFIYRGLEDLEARGGIRESLSASAELLWTEPEQAPTAASRNTISLEEMQAGEQQARQKGFEEGAAHAQASFEKILAAERGGLAAALSEFAKSREAYYQRIEEEVVHLVLAMARKVLHRESQLDPMLLKGVVRVALEGMASGTVVKLRVPASQVDAWREAIRSMATRNLQVEVTGDDSLKGPRCLIVTEMGTTDASLEAQLSEIERGFLDLLSQRPANGPTNGTPSLANKDRR
jgi:flagellar assembly protein FliH